METETKMGMDLEREEGGESWFSKVDESLVEIGCVAAETFLNEVEESLEGGGSKMMRGGEGDSESVCSVGSSCRSGRSRVRSRKRGSSDLNHPLHPSLNCGAGQGGGSLRSSTSFGDDAQSDATGMDGTSPAQDVVGFKLNGGGSLPPSREDGNSIQVNTQALKGRFEGDPTTITKRKGKGRGRMAFELDLKRPFIGQLFEYASQMDLESPTFETESAQLGLGPSMLRHYVKLKFQGRKWIDRQGSVTVKKGREVVARLALLELLGVEEGQGSRGMAATIHS
ncbi:hypothetical protein IE53DRAFT_386957 [Violaceomyces palustris]|uniref:Uncharacterized protein n=1 Tax=Violaceomyces palustris TaxID=1673888 RepID=A0ACD0NY89_9BASI|nr:hypothetical protein IE53DRAFT_386957 [Violaceomyces palustris]